MNKRLIQVPIRSRYNFSNKKPSMDGFRSEKLMDCCEDKKQFDRLMDYYLKEKSLFPMANQSDEHEEIFRKSSDVLTARVNRTIDAKFYELHFNESMSPNSDIIVYIIDENDEEIGSFSLKLKGHLSELWKDSLAAGYYSTSDGWMNTPDEPSNSQYPKGTNKPYVWFACINAYKFRDLMESKEFLDIMCSKLETYKQLGSTK